MRRLLCASALALSTAVLAIAPTPVASQDAELQITPTTGQPGDVVSATLDPAAVSASCMTDLAEMQSALGAAAADVTSQLGGLTGDEATAANVMALVFTVLAGDARAQQVLDASYVLTFVDIATQQPIGTRSSFDPVTGEGTLTVPTVDPGLWGVAATCVEPDASDPARFQAMVDAATAYLVNRYGPGLDLGTIVLDLLVDPAIAEELLLGALPPIMVPQAGARWVQTFTIPASGPPNDPAVAAFCAALPTLPTVADQLLAALAALPEDDGSMSDADWAAAEDWAALATELEALVDQVQDLLDAGDASHPADLGDEWDEATAPLRQVRDALQAVSYDLSTPSGRLIAGQLRAGASGGTGQSPAVAALTDWFLANCLPGTDPGTSPAPAAQPVTAQPRFTG